MTRKKEQAEVEDQQRMMRVSKVSELRYMGFLLIKNVMV